MGKRPKSKSFQVSKASKGIIVISSVNCVVRDTKKAGFSKKPKASRLLSRLGLKT